MTAFGRYIGIDYSGAQTPTASLKGLRVYVAADDAAPVEVLPPPSLRKYWTRRGIAEWLVERLSEEAPTLVGIDHGFSFPLRYFEVHGLLPDWPTFLADFQRHWPTDEDHTYVDFVRNGAAGNGAARMEMPAGGARRGKGRRCEIGLSIRCAGTGGQVYPRRDSMAALHPSKARCACSLLALRRCRARLRRRTARRYGLSEGMIRPHSADRAARASNGCEWLLYGC